MWLRILIAGIIGGILVFIMGFVCHGIIGLQGPGRAIWNIPDSASFIEHLKTRDLKPGLYLFPDMPIGADQKDQAKMDEANERYKAGPSGLLLVMPSGHDMMTLQMLGMEFVTDVISALLAAWIVSLIGADVGFGRRWLAVVVMGAFAWFSLSASYGIWYHFPHTFIHDEFL